jgi:tetratricopeptide (TPR) repeat protein
MRACLEDIVAEYDASKLNDNSVFEQVFGRVMDGSEDTRVKVAEAVWKDGVEAHERGDVEEATKLFEAAIDGRCKGLCSDIKEGRDRVVEMRRELLALHAGQVVGGGGDGGVWDLLGGFFAHCACCPRPAPSLFEDNDYKIKVAGEKHRLASDLDDRGDYDQALALYEEARVLFRV